MRKALTLMLFIFSLAGLAIQPCVASSADPESALWNEVKDSNTVEDLETYLEQYPKGRFVILAKEHIRKLRQEADNRTLLSEQQAWQAAEQSGTEADYQHYLKTYPQGRFTSVAQIKIRKLQDDELWKRALKVGTHSAMQSYLEKYPAGRHVAEAKKISETPQPIPPRPDLPFTVKEDVWRALEASTEYLNTPRQRTIRVSYQASKQMDYTGTKSSALPKPEEQSESASYASARLSDKCSSLHMHFTSGKTDIESTSYSCGNFVTLGSKAQSGEITGTLQNLSELQGSLFPMRIGAKRTMRVQQASPLADRDYGSVRTSTCEVTDQLSARELNPKLTGIAWQIHCKSRSTFNSDFIKTSDKEVDDYYLEDLGVFLSQIGQMDFSKNRFVLPVPGSQTVFFTTGEYGSITTTTFESYEWSVGE